jgi:hypothetical protein
MTIKRHVLFRAGHPGAASDRVGKLWSLICRRARALLLTDILLDDVPGAALIRWGDLTTRTDGWEPARSVGVFLAALPVGDGEEGTHRDQNG